MEIGTELGVIFLSTRLRCFQACQQNTKFHQNKVKFLNNLETKAALQEIPMIITMNPMKIL